MKSNFDNLRFKVYKLLKLLIIKRVQFFVEGFFQIKLIIDDFES